MRDKYKKQVALLIRIMPSVYRIKEFAVHDKKFLLSFEKGCPDWNLFVLAICPFILLFNGNCSISEI